MKTIQIASQFTLTLEDGSKVPFGVGSHEVEDDVAEHWYVKSHIGKGPVLAQPSTALDDGERAELEALRADKLAREKAEAEAKAKADSEDKSDADKEAAAKEKAEAESKAKAEAEAKAKTGNK